MTKLNRNCESLSLPGSYKLKPTTVCVYTGCIKKKVIELLSALARPRFNLQK